MKRSWVEIDLNQIKKNYLIYKNQMDSSQKIMAVVKANAYGHGDTQVAKELQDIGVTDFAVSNINEAIKLREGGIKGQILILGYTPVECSEQLLRYDITQALLSEEYAEALAQKNIKIKTQFAIDTGMNRIGLNADSIEQCAETIRKYSCIFNMTGIFTHLCVADTPSEDIFTQSQILKFKNIAEAVKDLRLQYIHCMNSAGGIWKPTYGNMVRLGIILYGLKPDYSNVLPNGIKSVLQWKSVISMIKDVNPGETIGYGRTYMTTKKMKVATIPTGYADGYNRLLSNMGYVVIRGKKAPIVGRVCMDQFMVDVTDIADAEFMDEVILIGDEINADEMGRLVNTIGYEIVCNIASRVERIFLN